ncbi:hypothetical protein CORMATOL_01724 [Corynebacterium matruchotii ATCC 33806]|uniref:Uncharacterized protein n=1 Tax=Corynebacterium matruchotii ATCC 33806 TaxID=566549 RepID=C0E403_9CORY|nr:hypothetical protein CORMATOL_01724 [Corynebacterium matruchotii ATCC 33806]
MRLLEDETNVVQSEFLQLFHAQLGQILTSNGDGATGGQVFDRAAAFDTAKRQF